MHFVIDTDQADQLREEWMRGDRGIVLDFIDTPDRRLARAAAELVSREAAVPGTHVTAVLPRRSYSPLLGRLLHDRTADKIAAVVSHIPNAAATIVPFDVRSRLEVLHERQLERERESAGQVPGDGQAAPGAAPATMPAAARADAARPDGAAAAGTRATARRPRPRRPTASAPRTGPRTCHRCWPSRPLRRCGTCCAGAVPSRTGEPAAAPAGGTARGQDNASYHRPAPAAGVNPIGSLTKPGRATVAGRVRAVEIRPVERNSVLAAEISDATGDLTALFYGRSHIPGTDVRGAGPLPRRGRDPQRPPGDDQPGLRAPRARRDVPAGRGTILTAGAPGGAGRRPGARPPTRAREGRQRWRPATTTRRASPLPAGTAAG